MEKEVDKESLPIWKIVSDKLTPFLTRDDFISMDKERYSSLVKRLKEIGELTEQESNYANINRDLIIIRMGLIHNLPEITDDSLELILKQLAVHLASLYYTENEVSSWEEAENKVLDVISSGFESKVTMGLSPKQHLESLRAKLNEIGTIDKKTVPKIISEIEEVKDKLMQAGISGVTLRKLTDFSQKLKRAEEKDLPTKHEIIEETYIWQELITK